MIGSAYSSLVSFNAARLLAAVTMTVHQDLNEFMKLNVAL